MELKNSKTTRKTKDLNLILTLLHFGISILMIWAFMKIPTLIEDAGVSYNATNSQIIEAVEPWLALSELHIPFAVLCLIGYILILFNQLKLGITFILSSYLVIGVLTALGDTAIELNVVFIPLFAISSFSVWINVRQLRSIARDSS